MELKSDSKNIGDHVEQNLATEALRVQPILSYCESLYENGLLSPSDLAGIFILSYLGLRRNKSWSNGCLKILISQSLTSTNCNASSTPSSIEISSVPGLLDILDESYVKRRIMKMYKNSLDEDGVPKITVLSIFDGLQLRGIKNNSDDYVNRCLVNWAYGLRPCCLMFRIPSPLEVLIQQSNGSRVITLFLTQQELERKHISMLYYMDGMQNHAKDSFEFLLHDMKHMEHFKDCSIHFEQIGFFRCFLKLSSDYSETNQNQRIVTNSSKKASNAVELRPFSPKKFFTTVCGYDKLLWRELEYVISDMNCYCTHLMQYVLAKMLFATERLLKTLPCATCCYLESHTDTKTDTEDGTDTGTEDDTGIYTGTEDGTGTGINTGTEDCTGTGINTGTEDGTGNNIGTGTDIPSSVCESDRVSGSDNRHRCQGQVLQDLKGFSTHNALENIPHNCIPHRVCSDVSHTSSECNVKRLKSLLLDRWLLLLKLFGMKPFERPPEGERGIEEEGNEDGDGDGDIPVQCTVTCKEEHGRIQSSFSPTHRQHDLYPPPVPLSVSTGGGIPVSVSDSTSITVSTNDSTSSSIPVSVGANKSTSIPVTASDSTSALAHAAAVGMVHTAFKDRGPLTADEGAALRLFFSEIGSH